jgi:hypothetical protein
VDLIIKRALFALGFNRNRPKVAILVNKLSACTTGALPLSQSQMT